MQPKLGLVVFSLALLLGAAIKELHPLLWLEVEPSQGLPVSFWHLLSAHFVHFNLYHALLNIAGVWLCYGLAYELFNRYLPLKVIFLALGISLGLWLFSAEVFIYAGFSGVLYGLFVLGLLPKAIKRDRTAAFALVCILGWLLWQLFIGGPEAEKALIGGEIASEAHTYGCALAVLWLVLAGAIKALSKTARFIKMATFF